MDRAHDEGLRTSSLVIPCTGFFRSHRYILRAIVVVLDWGSVRGPRWLQIPVEWIVPNGTETTAPHHLVATREVPRWLVRCIEQTWVPCLPLSLLLGCAPRLLKILFWVPSILCSVGDNVSADWWMANWR